MQRSTRRAGRSGVGALARAAALLLLVGAAPTPAAAQPPRPSRPPTPTPMPTPTPVEPTGVRLRTTSPAERAGLLHALDSLWIPFAGRADAFTTLDSLVLDDVAAVLSANPSLRLRLWASAPDAPDLDAEARPTGANTALAGRRRSAVRDHLLASGVDAAQLAEQGEDPTTFPSRVRWRTTGGTFLFVAGDADLLLVPASHARLRVRAAPGSEVFLLPRSIVDRDTTLACAPPLVTRFEVVGADSVAERPYPPRPVLTVARDRAGVIVTRHHDVDAGRDPDLVDLLTALPDPRCRR